MWEAAADGTDTSPGTDPRGDALTSDPPYQAALRLCRSREEAGPQLLHVQADRAAARHQH